MLIDILIYAVIFGLLVAIVASNHYYIQRLEGSDEACDDDEVTTEDVASFWGDPITAALAVRLRQRHRFDYHYDDDIYNAPTYEQAREILGEMTAEVKEVKEVKRKPQGIAFED